MSNATQPSDPDVIDVRSLVPAQRHTKIFELVDALAPGGRFILVNDHDEAALLPARGRASPAILLDLSGARPEVWRVEIGKLVKAA